MTYPTSFTDDLRARASARLGAVLKEKWRLDCLLGMGGMASVYAATHTRNSSRVAIKMLHAELSVHASIRARFLREGYAGNTVEHPGTVKVIDDDTAEDGAVFLVMELLEGEGLDARCKRLGGTLPPEDVLRLADPLLGVLAAAHGKGVVHRDLKPENIFITRDSTVKILDFGIAQLREMTLASDIATKTGAAMGTPQYMPPEQARGLWDEVDARSDLWAVGATMFRLLTGRMVHLGRTPNETLIAAATKPAPSLAEVAPNLPAPLVRVVDRALAFAKEDRWPDARAMQQAVRDAHNAMVSTSAPDASAEEPSLRESHDVATLVLPRDALPSTEVLPRADQPPLVLVTEPGSPVASAQTAEPPVTTTDSSTSEHTAPPLPAPSSRRRWAGLLLATGVVLASALTAVHLLGGADEASPRPSSSSTPTPTAAAGTSPAPAPEMGLSSAPSAAPPPSASPPTTSTGSTTPGTVTPKPAPSPKPPPSKPKPSNAERAFN